VDEQFVNVGDVELCYETFGDPADPAMLLVMGLGTQMLGWHEELCRELAGHGLFVIRYDNRDSGRSTHLRHAPTPSMRELVLRRPRTLAYTLGDLADDGVGLLDALGIERAHVVGASMGGMIAQVIAVRHPGRVLTLTSIMSMTGSLRSGQPGPRIWPFFLQRPARDADAYADRLVRLLEAVGSRGFERDEDELRATAALAFSRSSDTRGSGRQLAAILAAGNRTRELRSITAPTLVIHGTDDRLVPLSGGRATARAIPGARLVVVEGMGHDMPRGAWPQIVEAVVQHTARAGDAGARSTAA
jgi:pimeloyl-ACP methyl ester carboxylesterase